MCFVNQDSHRPWAVDEIAREVHGDVTDSLGRLHGGGLIHRLEGFVWASRARLEAKGFLTINGDRVIPNAALRRMTHGKTSNLQTPRGAGSGRTGW